MKQTVPLLWGTSNGTFNTDKVGDTGIFFVKYSCKQEGLPSARSVEYNPGGQPPIYDLIIGKQTLHNLGVVLDFKEKTTLIDDILLPMRNISNL